MRPLVVLSLKRDERLLQGVLELAREWEWDLLDLQFTRGALPADPVPRGALVSCLPNDPLVRQLRKMGCPAVRVGMLPHPRDALLPAVLPDLAARGQLAADHFAERGFRQVGFVGHHPWSDARLVYEAFRDRVTKRGLACHLYQIVSGDRKAGESDAEMFDRRAEAIGAWLAGLPKPIGIHTYGDTMAAGLCAVCRKAGLAVPETVAILGSGNEPLVCELSPVALSSVDLGHRDCARQAMLLLRRLMDGAPAPKSPVMTPPGGVVVRHSTDVLAVDDPAVARAMRFMWDHLDQDLSVDAVAAEVGLHRRSLERAFRAHLKRGVNSELRRKRLERCCELLRTTTTPIIDLAVTLGFHSSDYLHCSFRRAFGTTPRKYRLGEVAKEE